MNKFGFATNIDDEYEFPSLQFQLAQSVAIRNNTPPTEWDVVEVTGVKLDYARWPLPLDTLRYPPQWYYCVKAPDSLHERWLVAQELCDIPQLKMLQANYRALERILDLEALIAE
ncbi:hypothetical protein [Laspinema palackyanum]|uniref:hypothetical protein n=1 Tax=Laspinema palackyanum TaxID=3231601 RepID=UPI00345CF81F|nr:hypothetical protein [Laspinema sp. D2c]